jgi:hypothetical protein
MKDCKESHRQQNRLEIAQRIAVTKTINGMKVLTAQEDAYRE